jgi:hypothetical protein
LWAGSLARYCCVTIAGIGEQCGIADGHFGNSTDEKAEKK